MGRSLAFSAIAILLAGCSAQDREYSEEGATASFNVEETMAEADMVAPDIDPSISPGVAFDYSLRIGLPDNRISMLQERHADTCEEMGIDRCQIVGMNYDLYDNGRAGGQLVFLLLPTEARSFAREAVAQAEKMDGTLLSSRFRGEEVQTATDDSRQREANATERLAEIERTLNRGDLSADRRAQLELEAADLRGQRTGEQQLQERNERRLAKSPLTIDYAGEYSYGRTPVSQIADEALEAGRSSLTVLFTILIYLVTVALPWLLILSALLFGGRWAMKRFRSWQSRGDAPRDKADGQD